MYGSSLAEANEQPFDKQIIHHTQPDNTQQSLIHSSDIPSEIWLKIFSSLSPNEVCQSVLPVSVKWKAIAQDFSLWKMFAQHYLPQDFIKTSLPSSTLVLKKKVLENKLFLEAMLALAEGKEDQMISSLLKVKKLTGKYPSRFIRVVEREVKHMIEREENIAELNKFASLGSEAANLRKIEVLHYKALNDELHSCRGNVATGDMHPSTLHTCVADLIKELNDKDSEVERFEELQKRLFQNPFRQVILPEEVACIEALVRRGNKAGILKKIELLSQGKGYEKDLPQAKLLNDSLVKQEDETAIYRKLKGHTYGLYGYTKNPYEAMRFIESLIRQSNEAAKNAQISFLIDQGNTRQLKRIIELRIQEGNKKAILIKLESLFGKGGNSYHASEEEGKRFVKSLLTKGDAKSVSLVSEYFLSPAAEEYIRRRSGYGSEQYAQEITEKLIEKEDRKAISNRLSSFLSTTNYPFLLSRRSRASTLSNDQKRQFIDIQASKNNKKAINMKIYGLLTGIYGYAQDIRQAQILIRSLIEENKQDILYKRIKSCEGFELTQHIRAFSQIMVELGDRKALNKLAKAILRSGELYNNASFIPSYERVNSFREEILDKGDTQLFNKLKISGCLFGLFRYKQDREKALELIKKYKLHIWPSHVEVSSSMDRSVLQDKNCQIQK